jgi:rod shape-determining protein MreD
MGYFLSIPIMFIAAALQATLLPQVAIFGGVPDLPFLFTLAWALNSPLEEGIVWAFVGGIAKDSLSAAPLGTSVIGALLVVFGIHLVRRQLYSVGLFSLIWMTLPGSLIQQVVILIIVLASPLRPLAPGQGLLSAILQSVTYVIIPTIVYNLALIFPVYWLVRRLQAGLTRGAVG